MIFCRSHWTRTKDLLFDAAIKKTTQTKLKAASVGLTGAPGAEPGSARRAPVLSCPSPTGGEWPRGASSRQGPGRGCVGGPPWPPGHRRPTGGATGRSAHRLGPTRRVGRQPHSSPGRGPGGGQGRGWSGRTRPAASVGTSQKRGAAERPWGRPSGGIGRLSRPPASPYPPPCVPTLRVTPLRGPASQRPDHPRPPPCLCGPRRAALETGPEQKILEAGVRPCLSGPVDSTCHFHHFQEGPPAGLVGPAWPRDREDHPPACPSGQQELSDVAWWGLGLGLGRWAPQPVHLGSRSSVTWPGGPWAWGGRHHSISCAAALGGGR